MGVDVVVSKLRAKGRVEVRAHPVSGEGVETIIISRRRFVDGLGFVWNVEVTIPVQDFVSLYDTIKKDAWWLSVFKGWVDEGLILLSDI
jgi:hypothetical protein